MKKVIKKSKKAIVSIALIVCFALTSFAGAICWLKNADFSTSTLSANAISTQYSTFSDSYNKNNFKLSTNINTSNSIEENVNENVIMNYTTGLAGNNDSKTTVNISEQIDTMGNINDWITINDTVVGNISYDEEGKIVANNINYNQIGYEYEGDKIIAFSNLEDQYYYTYSTTNKLETVELNDEIYATFGYTDYGKISEETYYSLQKLFEHTNVATIENAYDSDSDTKIIARIYDYVNDNPYEITESNVSINGNDYSVITKITYQGSSIEFEYDYVYNGVPYITQVKTENDEFYLSYINDKILTKTRADEITTFIYSSTGEVLGMNYGKIIDSEFNSVFVSFVKDGFGNIIEANYLDAETSGDQIKLQVEKIYEQQFDSFGHKIFSNNYVTTIDTNFGFMGGMSIDEFNLVYINGNLYSPLMADYLNESSDSNLNLREFNTIITKRNNPTLNTVQKGVAIESLQNEMLTTYDTSSISGLKLVNSEMCVGVADVFTLPVNIDENNILRYPSKICFLVNLENEVEVNYYKNLTSTYFSEETNTYVVMDEYNLAMLSDKAISYQFVYNKQLFTVKYIQDGIYGYSIKSDYSRADYLKNTNIINYDTGKYVTYYESTINIDNYISEASFVTNMSSTKDLDTFFDELGYISTSIGETYQSVNFGDNSSYVNNLLYNTCNLNLPEYDKETQFITIDESGQYVVKDLTEEGIEFTPDHEKIITGITNVITGITFIVEGVILTVVSCGTFAIICGVVAAVGGVVTAICGVAQIVEGVTGTSWIVENILGGNSELLDTIASIASIVASVALIAGSLAFKSCFVAGTDVNTLAGYKNIEDVKVGDYVLTYDLETGEQTYNKVLNTYVSETTELCNVTVNNEKITSTLNHPYYANGEWVEANALQKGDKVQLSNGEIATVNDVEIIDCKPTKVYNINVDKTHNYYAEDVLVHNTCKPEDFSTKETDDFFKTKEYQNSINHMESKYKVNFGDDYTKATKFYSNKRTEFNKVLGNNISKNPSLSKKVVNLDDMIKKGVNPKIRLSDGSIAKIQYHHIYGKLGIPGSNGVHRNFALYPMTQDNHRLFHMANNYGKDYRNWMDYAKYIMNLVGW